MSLVINNNMMAANTARTLNQHYSNLATSTQRLSSGLRINSAADDAAGLAIRELQRADIAALQQGARNANDAISLIQTADGALGVIDEKLIRLKGSFAAGKGYSAAGKEHGAAPYALTDYVVDTVILAAVKCHTFGV